MLLISGRLNWMLSCKKCGGKVNPYLVVRNGEGSIVYICEKCDTGSEKLEEIAEKDKKLINILKN